MTTQQPVPLSAAPAAGQLVEHEGKIYETVREGRAFILIPPNTRTSVNPQAKAKADSGAGKDVPQNVFYNPIQQFNRDLSVLAIKAFGEDLCEKRSGRHERDSGKQLAKKERRKKQKGKVQVQDGAQAPAQAEPEAGRGTKRRRDGGDEIEEAPAAERPSVQLDGNGEEAGGMKRKREDEEADGEDHKRPKLGFSEEEESTVQLPENDAIPEDIQQDAHAGAVAGSVSLDDQAGNDAGSAQAEVQVAKKGSVNATVNGAHEQRGVNARPDQVQQPWKPRFRILDALSATGLRALRYAAEIPFATSIVANDMDRNAVKSIRLHVDHNKLQDKITANLGNAIGHMYGAAFPSTDSHGPHHVSSKYDVIDLDPYGTAAPFIDAALQALNDGGLLCVTCTDSGVFASCGYAEKTYSLYGGMPMKGNHSHEGGLRLIINSVASAAAKYGLAIEPLLSLSIDFYVRVFIRVTKSPADVKFLAGKTMLVYECDNGCGAWQTQMLGRNTRQTGKDGKSNNPTFNFKHGIALAPTADRLCEHCGSKTHISGPMWGGPLHNAAFVEKVLEDARDADDKVYQTKQRLEGMLDTALGELTVFAEAELLWQSSKREDSSPDIAKTPPETVDMHPFFFIPSAVAKVIHCIAPPEAAIKGALRHGGYRATRSHCKPGSVKTDAPWSVIWEIMREWVRQKQPIKEGALKEGQAGWRIMQAVRKTEEERNGHTEATEGDEAVEKTPDIVTEAKGAPAVRPPEDLSRMKVVFDEVLGKDKPGKKLVRYQQNPRENWGPMARAKGSA